VLVTWLEVIRTTGAHGNVRHIAEHGIRPVEVEHVLAHPIGRDESERTGRPIVFGFTARGRFLAVVFEQIDPVTVYPITAFDVEDRPCP